jgi:hypothetical protein
MITELTPEQEAQIQVYVDRYIEIGKKTDRINREKAIGIMEAFYKNILEKEPVPVVFAENPKEAWRMTCVAERFFEENVEVDGTKKQLIDEYDEEKDKISFIWPYLSGSFDSYLFAFYDYALEILKIEIPKEHLEKYNIWKGIMEMGLIYPLDHICIVSEKPTTIHMNEKGLHRDLGAALAYSGENDTLIKLYYLNGVEVPESIVMTPAEELDAKLVLTEKNAEVRAQIVKKIGIKKVLSNLDAKSVEKKRIEELSEDKQKYLTSTIKGNSFREYELLNLDVIDGTYRPYLKMLNPSTGEWHVEGVHPSCMTVEEALAWRDDETTYVSPKVLT